MGDRVIFDEAAIKTLFESTDGPVGKYLAKAAVKVTRRAKQLAPVDTGRLRSSIDNQLGSDDRGLFAIVGTDVEYAPYVEFGTRRMKPKPFLRPALDALDSNGAP